MSTVAAVDSPSRSIDNPFLPAWNRKILLLKNSAALALAYAKEHFHTAIDKYTLEVSTVPENAEGVSNSPFKVSSEETKQMLIAMDVLSSDAFCCKKNPSRKILDI